ITRVPAGNPSQTNCSPAWKKNGSPSRSTVRTQSERSISGRVAITGILLNDEYGLHRPMSAGRQGRLDGALVVREHETVPHQRPQIDLAFLEEAQRQLEGLDAFPTEFLDTVRINAHHAQLLEPDGRPIDCFGDRGHPDEDCTAPGPREAQRVVEGARR